MPVDFTSTAFPRLRALSAIDLPRASLPQLCLSQDIIEHIRTAKLEDDIRDDEVLDQIRHPPSETEQLDSLSRLSLRVFNAMTNASQQMYANVSAALREYDDNIVLDSYFTVKSCTERLTGVIKVMTDMALMGASRILAPFLN